jgi:hypothetical protein
VEIVVVRFHTSLKSPTTSANFADFAKIPIIVDGESVPVAVWRRMRALDLVTVICSVYEGPMGYSETRSKHRASDMYKGYRYIPKPIVDSLFVVIISNIN